MNDKPDRQAVVYLRTAHNTRATTQAIRNQRRACRRMARRLHASICAEYTDIAASGRGLDRPGLQRLIWHVSTQPTDYVLCADQRRLAADQDDFIGLLLRFAGYHTAVGLARRQLLIEVPPADDSDHDNTATGTGCPEGHRHE